MLELVNFDFLNEKLDKEKVEKVEKAEKVENDVERVEKNLTARRGPQRTQVAEGGEKTKLDKKDLDPTCFSRTLSRAPEGPGVYAGAFFHVHTRAAARGLEKSDFSHLLILSHAF